MSEHCEFGQFLDDAIPDKFVCGMINSKIRKRLLTEKDLTLEKATSIAFSLEASSHENELIAIKSEPSTVYNVTKERLKCFRCDGTNHLADSCRYKNFICNKCKLRGHLARVCTETGQSTNRNKDQRTNTVVPEYRAPDEKGKNSHGVCCCHIKNDGENVYCDEVEMIFINTLRGDDPYRIDLPINGIDIEFEIDTGARKSIVSELVYREKLTNIPLEKTPIALKTYSGEELKVLGKILVNIEYQQQSIETYIYVIRGNGPVLLGRDILAKLRINWSAVYQINSVHGRLHALKTFSGIIIG